MNKTSIFEDYDNGAEGRTRDRLEIHSHVSLLSSLLSFFHEAGHTEGMIIKTH